MLMRQSFEIVIDPLLPPGALWGLAAFSLLLIGLQFLQKRRFPLWRACVYALFLLALVNPALQEETRSPLRSVALVITDQSLSQSFGPRTEQSAQAAAYLQSTLSNRQDIELRSVSGPALGAQASRTDLFALIEENFADIPRARRAGVILITDGQIHDVPDPGEFPDEYGPVHVLLTGERNEKDRRIHIIEAPAYGITGQTITLKFSIEDHGYSALSDARVTINQAGSPPEILFVKPGEVQSLDIPVKHAGQNVIELSTETLADELTTLNNRAVIEFQGVRDRLKVLLVSGRPHSGGRAWRDLLTADASVDLVHFTILREPEKLDATPPSEMSLIAFPFRELFEIKLYDFDLIIFDRYSLHKILPEHYFDNIARYVSEGGGFLEISGPSYAGEDSIYRTGLQRILPAAPSGRIYKERYMPKVTDIGQTHPVTQSLIWKNGAQSWGPWLRQIGLRAPKGDVLMTGAQNAPLLVLKREGEGRVAQLASDQIWLWSRGYEGGGPYAELLRRVVHWLMKEPELDEQALRIQVESETVHVSRPDFAPDAARLSYITPDGTRRDLTLSKTSAEEEGGAALLRADITAPEPGIYEFITPGGESRYAIVGEADPPELRNILSTPDLAAPIANATGGGIFALHETAQPAIRLVRNQSHASGKNWLGLINNNAYSVTGSRLAPILPLWGWGIVLALAAVLCWWREGKRV